MKKNTASQKWRVYAWHRNTNVPATGIAETITATINKDFAGEVATDDTNPTEIGSGYYEFDLTQAETNAYQLSLTPTTTTNGVEVRALPETLSTQTAAAVDPSTLDASGVRSAVGMSSANLDTQLSAISGYVDCLPASWVTVPTAAQVSTQIQADLATEIGRIDASISSRQATVENLANAVTMAAQFSTMIVLDGAVYDFTEAALASAPAGTGLTAQQTRDAMKLAPTAGDPAVGSIDKHLNDIVEDTGTTLPAQIAALDIGGGTGSNTIQFEITNSDGGAALEGAKVTLRLNGILKATADTDETGKLGGNGLAVESTGTYELAVTCDGFNGHTDDLVVTAGENTMVEVELTAISITAPTNPDDCACAWLCLDENDAPVAGVIIRARPDTDVSGTGYAWSGHTREATSVAGTGLATINLPKGSKWWIRRDSGEEELFTVPETPTSTAVVSVRGGKRDTH